MVLLSINNCFSGYKYKFICLKLVEFCTNCTKSVLLLGSNPGVIRVYSSAQLRCSIGRIIVRLILTHCHLSACNAIVGGVCCQWQLSLVAWWACLLCSVLPSLLTYVTTEHSEG